MSAGSHHTSAKRWLAGVIVALAMLVVLVGSVVLYTLTPPSPPPHPPVPDADVPPRPSGTPPHRPTPLSRPAEVHAPAPARPPASLPTAADHRRLTELLGPQHVTCVLGAGFPDGELVGRGLSATVVSGRYSAVQTRTSGMRVVEYSDPSVDVPRTVVSWSGSDSVASSPCTVRPAKLVDVHVRVRAADGSDPGSATLIDCSGRTSTLDASEGTASVFAVEGGCGVQVEAHRVSITEEAFREELCWGELHLTPADLTGTVDLTGLQCDWADGEFMLLDSIAESTFDGATVEDAQRWVRTIAAELDRGGHDEGYAHLLARARADLEWRIDSWQRINPYEP